MPVTTLFFDFDSAVPPADASTTANYLANNSAGCGWSSYEVVGHTDRAGSNAYNEGLAMERANAVADVLAGQGISMGAMTVTGRGETDPAVETLDGERNPQNRRVEIKVR